LLPIKNPNNLIKVEQVNIFPK